MLEKIKQIVKETKSDGITRKLKATKYWNVIDNWSNIPGKGTEKIYLYINQIQKPICSCSSNISLKFISLTKGYNEFCSSRCSAAIKAQTERRNSTMMKRYGNIGLGIKKSRDKQQKTLKERYNINNPGQLKHNIERMKYNNPMFNDISVEKMKATNNKKYGSDCALSSPIIQDKIKKTNIKKYGHENAMQAKWPSDVLEILTNPEILEQKFKFLGIRGLQSELNVTHQVLMRYLTKYGIRSKLEYLPELDIINYIKLLGYTPLQNDRTIIKPLELDIVIPEMKIAIEHCGLYWHSDSKGKGRNYHKTKTTQANKVGYRLITIFEDEWLSKTEIIKSFLSQLLKKKQQKVICQKDYN